MDQIEEHKKPDDVASGNILTSRRWEIRAATIVETEFTDMEIRAEILRNVRLWLKTTGNFNNQDHGKTIISSQI